MNGYSSIMILNIVYPVGYQTRYPVAYMSGAKTIYFYFTYIIPLEKLLLTKYPF